jgi:hypothetical protein
MLGGAAAMVLLAAGPALADPMTTPAMSAPLAANPDPSVVDAGPLGNIYVTGAVTGLGYIQNNRLGGDKKARADVANAQVFIQKTEGLVQFFIQAGGYSIPTIGVPYAEANDTTKSTFGVVPQAFIKIVPTENFSIMAGKIPTLIGAEYTFTFQNTNITRGVVWNQENAVNRGVQLNYAAGPISASVSVNDGFYSEKYSWVSGLLAYTVDDSNVIAVAAGGNTSESGKTSSATPLLANNSQIYNLIWTHTSGPLTLTPYYQYTKVDAMPSKGVPDKGSTSGFALLGKYSFSDSFSLGGRAEYITTKNGTTNLLYGAGSKAMTLTLTPTYQAKTFFVRGELAYIKASDITPGAAFGPTGDKRSQTRALIETGFLF